MYSLYQIEKSCQEQKFNFDPPVCHRIVPPKKEWINFCGYSLATPLGVSACPIMHSQGIAKLAQLGFDFFTYKTIRSYQHPAHQAPNIYYINCNKQLTYTDLNQKICASDHSPTNPSSIAITNSFGNNSSEPELTYYDIAQARKSLSEGQLLNVSIFGEGTTHKHIAHSFAHAAQLAYNAGAHTIEVNLSCPNLITDKKVIFYDSDLVFTIINAVCRRVPLPVIIKVGVCQNISLLRECLVRAAQAGAQGVCGINTVPMQIIDNMGQPIFGNARKLSGVSGVPIRLLALDFVRQAQKIIKQEKLPLIILATGGVTQPEHFQELLNSGATIAMSATGTMWNPLLAMKYHQHYSSFKKKEQENVQAF
jgi:dihydroorotate dehydrogenase (NAD+) catalytic subunit